ncbi:hypothetical protein B296_00056770 [Ensete ventricosum]|uniref:Transposase (putative) gypsy type domain-containing protein n=1 Tax=Ensete ventricosum TaxID=4639 RepID=A0A426XDZ9_ENSVE|nr:hypothetical protein B296_00056770 [Ensete ventricosum]
MVSSLSFTTSEFTSPSSLGPSSRVESCHPSSRVGSRSEALSSSSSILTRSDVKAIKAMEVMKSCHDFDSTILVESLVLIRKLFSIPDKYALHAPQPRQRSYHKYPDGFSLFVDALEAGLRFPLHPVIGECLSRWRVSPSQIAPNSWRYLITFLGECRGSGIIPSRDLFLSCFQLCKGHGGYYLTARAGFRVEAAPSNNKGWKSRFMYISHPQGREFGLEWSQAFGKWFAEATSHPQKKVKASDRHRTQHAEGGSKPHSSKGKEQTQHYCMALANHAHDVGQVISLMDNKAEGLKKEIIDLRAGSGPKAIAAAELKAAEAQTLVDDLKVELEEANRRRALLETKVDNYRVDLADSREQLKEV